MLKNKLKKSSKTKNKGGLLSYDKTEAKAKTPSKAKELKAAKAPKVPTKEAKKATSKAGTCKCGCGTATINTFACGHYGRYYSKIRSRASKGDKRAIEQLKIMKHLGRPAPKGTLSGAPASYKGKSSDKIFSWARKHFSKAKPKTVAKTASKAAKKSKKSKKK